MATSGLYGNSSESIGLYGNTNVFGGTYFQWFIFQQNNGQPVTPTGGSWDFTTNTGTPPTGWTTTVASVPTAPVWFSTSFVDSRNPTVFVWSAPSLLTSSNSIYASAYSETFTGNGTQTVFTLANSPVTVNNTDVSINGVVQVPGVDYTINAVTLTTTTAVPNRSVMLVKYKQSLPNSYYGLASNVGFTPVGTLTSTNVQSAIAEVLTDYSAQTGAASIGFTPVGAITSTNVQSAVTEVVTDFALSSGSSTIGYLSAGSGAVATTVQTKFRENNVSVKDFGAVGNGTTDDTNAIEAAWATGNNIYFPSGQYKVTRSLNFTGTVGRTITGSGRYGAGRSVIFGTSAIGNYPVIDLSGSNGIRIKSLLIQNYSTDTCFIGILLARVGSGSSGLHSLEDVSIYGNFSNSCLYSSSSEENTHYDLWAESTSVGARAVTLIDVPETGITSAYQNILSPSGGNTVTRFISGRFINQTSNNSNRSFYIKSARQVMWHGCYINAGATATYNVEINNCTVLNFNSVTSEGTPSYVVGFIGTNSNTFIDTCVFNGAQNSSVYGATGSIVTGLNINSTTPSSYIFIGPTLKSSSIDGANIAALSVTTLSLGNVYRNFTDKSALGLASSNGDMYTIGQPGVTINVGTVSVPYITQFSLTTGNVNNIDRAGANLLQVITTTGALVITGFTAGSLGQEITFSIPLTFQVTIAQNTGSSAGNVIYTTTGANVIFASATGSVKTIKFTYQGTGWQMQG